MSRKSFLTSYFLLNLFLTSIADVYVYNAANKLIEEYDEQGAGFGPGFPSAGLKGVIVQTNPRTACTPIAPPPNVNISDFHWIALIPRTQGNGSCDFDLKVENAQNANFSAVIVYNYEDQLIKMGTHGRTVHIPSTLIRLSDANDIILHYTYNPNLKNSTPTYHVKIISDGAFNFGPYLVPFAVVISAMFLVLVGFMLVKCCLQRRRTRRHRLPRSALKQLKTKKFAKGDRWEVCAICLDDYVEGAKLRILPCDHAYHMKCIDPWLLNNRRQCPVCKRYVFPNHDHSDEDNHERQQTRTASNEQTPLLGSTEPPAISEDGRNRFLREAASNDGATHVTFARHESSESDEDPVRFTVVTTTNSRSSLRSGRFPSRPLPRRSRSNETHGITNNYGSVNQESSTSTVNSSRSANFFVGSLNGMTTDNTTVSGKSINADSSDIETIDDKEEEEMHSVLASSESNPAYISDEESTSNVDRTQL